ANFFVFEGFFGLQADFGPLLHAWLVRLGPVDHADRVVHLWIIGVHLRGLTVIILRVVKLLHLQVQIGDAFGAVDLLFLGSVRINYSFVLFNGLLGHAVVVFSIHPGDVLIGESGRQIHVGNNQVRIKRNRLLEMINGLFVMVALVRLHSLVQLVARL